MGPVVVCLHVFIDLIIAGHIIVSVYWKKMCFYNAACRYMPKVQCSFEGVGLKLGQICSEEIVLCEYYVK
jgi:hypothetical protein